MISSLSRVNAAERNADCIEGGGVAGRHVVGICTVLLALRLLVAAHPIPVHPDESAFMAGIGFPAVYPVHHPGYGLWVALGTLGHVAGLSPYWSFAVWSAGASIAVSVIAYFVFRRFMFPTTAYFMSMTLGVCPLMWFSSVTALTYAPAACIMAGAALLTLRAIERNRGVLILIAAGVLAVGMLVRSDLFVFAGPMVLYGAWKAGRWRTVLNAGAVLGLGVLLLPCVMHWLYERGDDPTVSARLQHTRDVLLGQSILRAGFGAILRNGLKVLVNVGWDLGLAVPVLLWSVWRLRGRVVPLVWLWVAPGLLLIWGLHVVQGYFLPLMAGFYLAVGAALQTMGPRRGARIAAILMCATALQFMFYPWSAESSGWKRTIDAKIGYLSWKGLREIDQRGRIHEDGDFWRTEAHDLTR